ncbi:MAG TPA: hypothetical protein VGU90_03725 [Terriglobales bacterium]|nr:hypothetical protein [Terriglobales bacterium]
MSLLLLTTGNGQQSASDEEHRLWIGEVMQRISTIQPGMTRGDLGSVFVEEGGISTRTQRKYVYKSCPYIKVDITFAPADKDQWTERPEDKIISISRPYLEGVIVD